jgi:simple sugar transport system substrate-binding protein
VWSPFPIARVSAHGALAALAVIASLLLAACGSDGGSDSAKAETTGGATGGDSPHIIAVTHGQAADPYWSVIRHGMESAAEEQGVDFEYKAPEKFDIVEMRRLVEAAGARKPDGLIVTLPDPDALGPVVREIADSGVPVIAINTGQDAAGAAGARLFIGQDEELAGEAAGREMAAAGVRNAICLNPEVGNIALDERCRGFADGLGAKSKVVPVTLDPTVVEQRVAAALQQDSSIDGVLTTAAPTAEAALPAIEGRDVALASIDISPGVLRSVENREMLFAIDDQAYLEGYEAVLQLSLFNRYKLMLPQSPILTGPLVVGPEEAPEIIGLAEDKYH